MSQQSPMISMPKKATEEVDWTTPIRQLISQSYGENPDGYAAECAALQRCRQDAVRGAGSDMTARDLLYKYFGQLELLELRFSEIKVNFPWKDAFTAKQITQTSIAYEKASILFQIAATHSAIAAAQSRSDPEGLKRAFHYFKTCAGMLTYINDNFLHAPSTDLNRDVVKFLAGIILAQATEVFFEKCTDEKKGNALVAKIGAQAASMYTALGEDVKEFMGKGIFDRNWVTLIQIKSKYFTSLAQYYRGMADDTAGKHGDALVRFTVAETQAKEALRIASSFGSSLVPNLSPTLPSDAGPAIQERTKAHLARVTERKNDAQRENDLIYNAVLPSAEALPAIEKISVASPIPIQEVYSTPEVQKTIGQDIFIRLVPLSVHESASVYSEEKAKFVRAEVEKTEIAESELRSALDGMGVKDGLGKFRAMAEGEMAKDAEVPVDVRRWKEDIAVMEERESVESVLTQLMKLKNKVKAELESISNDFDGESRECEMMRVKYEHLWTQSPSSGASKSLRQDLKSHFGSLEAATASDGQVLSLWESTKSDIGLLLSPQLEELFIASLEGRNPSESLLDLDISVDGEDGKERARIGVLVTEIDERLGRLNKISRERNEVLKDLKEKVQNDDVSHLLLLNRRNTGVEPALFAAELEKFKPYQQRLAATGLHQETVLQELSSLWKALKDAAGKGKGLRKWDEREKRKQDLVRRFSRARDTYMAVKDGLAKGLQFYAELGELTSTLRHHAKGFVTSRTTERENLVAQIEVQKRLSSTSSPPPPPPPPLAVKPQAMSPAPPTDFVSSFANLSLQQPVPPPLPSYPTQQNSQLHQSAQAHPYSYTPPSQTPSQPSITSHTPTPFFPPPPPPTQQTQPSMNSDPYASLGMFNTSYSTSSTQPQATQSPPQLHAQSNQFLPNQGIPPPPPAPSQVYTAQFMSTPQPLQSPPLPVNVPSPQQQPPNQYQQYQNYQAPSRDYQPPGGYTTYGQSYGR